MQFEQHQSRPSRGSARRRGIVAALTLGLSSIAAAQTPAVRDVVLASDTFDIPFNVDNVGMRPAEVRLYVADPAEVDLSSTQRPSTPSWTLLQRQPPDAGHFRLTNVPDGAFWYATETISDAQMGKTAGAAPTVRPGLRVVVDTTQPDVQLVADADSDGRVTARFEVEDATATRAVSLYFATDTTRQWKTATIRSLPNGGRFEIFADDQWKQMEVRLRVVDAAGNETIVKRILKKPRVAGLAATRFASGPPQLPMPSTPAEISNDFGMAPPPMDLFGSPESIPTPSPTAAPFGQSLGVTPPASTPPAASPQTPAEAMRPLTSAIEDIPSPTGQAIESDASSTVSPSISNPALAPNAPPPTAISPPTGTAMSLPIDADSLTPETPFRDPSSAPVAPNDVALAGPDQAGPGSAMESPGDRKRENSGPWSAVPRRPNDPTSSNTFPRSDQPTPRPMDPSMAAPRERRNRPAVVGLAELAQRSPVRYSDSKQFSLDYEIEAIGGAGVGEIELYGTLDGGQTWKRWGSDPDKATPFDIETAGEGTFGFTIVVFASNGLASPRPQPGDAPDIVVVVDETSPEVAITGARYGEGDRSGSLVVRYQCEDDHLKTRPITLAFSESMDGPWTTIAAGLRNLGDHVWPADSQLPRQIYLRVDATDEAGNVGSYVLEKPVDTRGLAPRARIRAFRPISTRLDRSTGRS